MLLLGEAQMALSLASTVSAEAEERLLTQTIEAMFGVQAGFTILSALTADAVENSVESVANGLVAFADNTATAETFATSIVANLGITVESTGSADAVTEAVDFVAAQLNAADEATWGETVLAVTTLFSGLEDDETYGAAAAVYNDAVNASLNYSLNAKNTEINANSEISTIYLTTAADHLVGTSGDDTFIARGNGSLDNADIIDGGEGENDTLEVMLDSNETAESPLLMNIEILKVQGQQHIESGEGENDVDGPYATNIDAGDMGSAASDTGVHGTGGVREYWSEDSRSHVTIEDVSRDSHITTIGMRETDPGTDVDLNVFFDPENITSGSDAGGLSRLSLDLVNIYNLEEGFSPLEGYASFNFVVTTDAGTEVFNIIISEFDPATTLTTQVISTYEGLFEEINLQLAVAGFSGVVELVEETAKTATFPIDVDTYSEGQVTTNTYVPFYLESDTAFVGKSFNALTGADETYISGQTSQSFSAYGTNVTTDIEDPDAALTSVNVILDRVGKNSQGGDLLIGSDSTGNSGSAGIQQFDVQVDRDSWLETVSSTNNTLEVINVENIDTNSDGEGNLRINLIEDVRVFDSSDMVGDVNLTATLDGSNIVDKYMDLVDDNDSNHDTDDNNGFNGANDNSELNWANVVDNQFSYDFGSGADTLNLSLTTDNALFEGTTTREDFILEVNGGAGNDDLTVELLSVDTDEDSDTFDELIVDVTSGDDTNWYRNSTQNANLSINGEDGDDTIWTPGTGNFAIDGGNGSDTIYVDNTADKAQFYFNYVGAMTPADLDSQDAASVLAVNAVLQVEFKGFESVDIEIANSYDKRVNVVIDDLSVNQAIKKAINDDAVLSKLLIAEDGPGNTLIVTSLIDGFVIDTSSLNINFDSRPLTDGQATLSTPVILFTDVNAVALAELTDGYDTNGLNGEDSTATSDNTINGGEADGANDVIVLGTGEFSNDTVVFSGFGNATDFVVNFDDSEVIVGDAGSKEIQTFTATAAGDLDTNGNLTVTLGSGNTTTTAVANAIASGDTAIQVATKLVAQINADLGAEVTASNVSGASAVVTLTYLAVGDVAAATIAANIATDATVVVAETTAGATAAAATVETFTAVFDTSAVSTVAATETIIFDGVTVTLTDTDASGEVTAFEIAEQVAATDFTGGTIGYTVTGFNYSLGEVTFEALTADNDTVAGDFTGTAIIGDASATVPIGEQTSSIAAVVTGTEVQTLTMSGADRSGTVTFTIDDVDYDVALTVGNAVDVAAEVAAALTTAAIPGVATVVVDAGNLEDVIVTWAAEGVHDPITMLDGSVVAAIADSVADPEGVDATLMSGAGTDMLDFSDYNASGVYVNGVLVAGTAPDAVGEQYIWLTEFNPGDFDIDVYVDDIGDGVDPVDPLIGFVGIVDFGETQNFTAANFII